MALSRLSHVPHWQTGTLGLRVHAPFSALRGKERCGRHLHVFGFEEVTSSHIWSGQSVTLLLCVLFTCCHWSACVGSDDLIPSLGHGCLTGPWGSSVGCREGGAQHV